jgi:Fur family ferric uptake transcriptional regulator
LQVCAQYALCAHTCNEASHNHEHVHFKCEACGNTTCLENVQIPALKLPQGYQVHETNLLIQGQCPNCR